MFSGSLKEQLNELLNSTLAKLKRVGCGSHFRKGPGQTGEDLGDLRVLYRTRPKPRERLPRPATLLEASAQLAASRISIFSRDDIDALPPDLAQVVVEALVAARLLNYYNLSLFQGQFLYSLDLTDCRGASNEWLALVTTSQLMQLTLAGCREIGDGGLAHLSRQTALTHLVLDRCERITDAGLYHLTGLTKLQHLSARSLDELTARGMPALNRLRKLRYLCMEQCRNLTGLHHLKGLQQLEELDLGWCSSIVDSDVRAIAGLASLTSLQLTRTKVGDAGVAALVGLTRLRRLGLAYRFELTAACMDALLVMPSLEILDLGHCNIPDTGLAKLGAMTGLVRLNVASAKLTDSSIARWTNLTSLQALNLDACCLLTDKALEVCAMFPNLEELDVSEARITSSGAYELTSCRNLKSLNLSFTKVDNTGLGAIAPLTNLTTLTLDCREVTDAGLRLLSSLTQLRHLDLFDAKIDDAGCSHLKAFTQLETLEVCGGRLSDTGMGHIAAVTSLTRLSLRGNRGVTDASVPKLLQLTRLELLNLSQTGVTGPGVLPLAQLPNLRRLWLDGMGLPESKAVALERINPYITASTRSV